MNILKVFDKPIAFQRPLVTITGSINAALMLSQAIYWAQRTTLPGGWFYKTRDQWEEETGMTRYEQEGARKVLREKGLLEEKLVGVPAKLHYRVNENVLRSSLVETNHPVGGKPTNKVVGKPPTITETTTEIKTTTPPVGDGEDSTSSEEKDSPRARVRRVFAHYLEKFGRRPRMYELTPKRMKVGLVRLEECTRKCGGDRDKAEELMCLVVDELSESSFHLGKNEAKERYIDWIDHLFKNSEKLDWWLRKLGVE